MQWSSRFNSKLDECMHLVLALILSDILDAQKSSLVDNFGEQIVEEAIENIITNYSSLISRIG